jgi:hypothetical protein
MLRVTRSFTLLGALAVTTMAAPGGNANNTKHCQKGGWASLARTGEASTAFVSQGAGVSYAAQGGTIVDLYVAVPSITITFTPRSNSNFRWVRVHLRDFKPSTAYQVTNYADELN